MSVAAKRNITKNHTTVGFWFDTHTHTHTCAPNSWCYKSLGQKQIVYSIWIVRVSINNCYITQLKCEFLQNVNVSHSVLFICVQFLLLIRVTRVSWHSKSAALYTIIHCSSVLSTIDEEKYIIIFTTTVAMSETRKKHPSLPYFSHSRFLTYYFLLLLLLLSLDLFYFSHSRQTACGEQNKIK